MSTSRANLCEIHSYCNELRRQEKFCDIIIKVENRMFPCHRIILASALEYFRIMFSGNYNEATQKKVELKGVNADDFELLLTHIYGSSVNLEGKNVHRLLRVTNYVGSDTLSNICEEYVIKNKERFPLDTFIDIFVLASELGKTVLVNELVERLARNFYTVTQEEKSFCKSLCISRTGVEKIFDNLDMVANRTAVLEFLIHWTRQHPTEVNILDYYMSRLELPSDLRTWFNKSVKGNIANDGEDTSTVDRDRGEEEQISYNECKDEGETSVMQESGTESPTVALYCCDNADDGEGKSLNFISQYEYNTNSNSIRARKEIGKIASLAYSQNIKSLKSVFIKGVQFIFVSGLLDYYHQYATIHTFLHLPSIEKFVEQNKESSNDSSEIRSPSIIKLASVSNIRIPSSSSICVCETNVYIYEDNVFLMFNGELNEWTHLNECERPVRTSNSNLVSYENNLYLLGGKCLEYNETLHTSKRLYLLENGKIFQRYDPREGIWSQLPHMTYRRTSLSSCVHKDLLYATGGEHLSRFGGHMECYDFKACKWRVLETRIPTPKINHRVIGHNDELYFFGGDNDFTWYSYNLEKEVWSDVLSIPQKRGSFQISRILDAEVMM